MNLRNDLSSIFQKNKFHGRIIVLALYIEYFFRNKRIYIPITFLLKVFRKLVIQGKYHCDISPISFTSIDAIATLRLPHPYLIIIHGNAKIHKNVTIYHNVTIGVIEGDMRYKLAPTISQGVYIGTGASILGDVFVANNCKIGAHSLILTNINIANKTITGIYKNENRGRL